MKTQEISVPRPGKPEAPSRIVIGEALPLLDTLLAGRRPIVITDPNLAASYPELIGRYPHIQIGLGETQKTLTTIEQVCRELLRMEADRGSYIVGIGGGIVTDITGFVASVYMRGVSGFGFVATSLLAQADASVGGKNGVNLDGYKNQIGVFNQPDFVLCDQTMLATLPAQELRAGLAEAIKCGLIGDAALFEAFEGETFETLTGNPELLHRILVATVGLKARVVAADEQEHGERKLLNLGHTFGHAIEKCTRHYLHGEAVAIGLCVAAGAAVKAGLLTADEEARIARAIRGMGLPTSIDPTIEVTKSQLIAAVEADKKREAQEIDFVLPSGLGRSVRRRMPLTELEALITDIL